MSRLRLSIHPARQTGPAAAGGAYGRPALSLRTVHECHRAAAGGFDAGGAVLDSHHGAHSGAKADAATGSGGGAGTGRNVAFRGKKTQKLWIWKAYDRTTGHLLDWECGGRDRATLQRLVERLKAWNVVVYYTDHWECYREVIAGGKLVQSKTQTLAIERNNGRQRHWLGRFRRRTVIVSRSQEMVNLSVALFAAFHVNHTLPTLQSLFT